MKINSLLPLLVVGSCALSASGGQEKSQGTASCYIQTAPRILLLKAATQMQQVGELIKHSNCSGEKIWAFFSTIQNIAGKISSSHLNRLLREEGRAGSIQLRPDSIEVFPLANIVARQVVLGEGLSVHHIKAVGGVYAVGVDGWSQVQLTCHACNSVGIKNLSVLLVDSVNGYRKNLWATMRVTRFGRVVVAARDIHPAAAKSLADEVKWAALDLSGLSSFSNFSDFTDQNHYIQSMDDLRYFKVNKFIQRGTPLKHSDLLPLNLVESGRLAQVVMKGNGLRLKTQAIARQAGKHGEFITLYNPQSKQQVRGRVVDFNRVEVEI